MSYSPILHLEDCGTEAIEEGRPHLICHQQETLTELCSLNTSTSVCAAFKHLTIDLVGHATAVGPRSTEGPAQSDYTALAFNTTNK